MNLSFVQSTCLTAVLLLLFQACTSGTIEKDKLPYLGEKEEVNGVTKYHEISDFKFVNQDSQFVTNATFEDKVYVVDFFFTRCRTICPIVKNQMLRIHDRFKANDDVILLSHTIDQPRDTVERLKYYADKLEVSSDKWHFVTGDKTEIYDMAKEYFITALEDADAPGGYDHSGNLILIDKDRRVRSFCNGLKAEDVDRFMDDIDLLLKEE